MHVKPNILGGICCPNTIFMDSSCIGLSAKGS